MALNIRVYSDLACPWWVLALREEESAGLLGWVDQVCW